MICIIATNKNIYSVFWVGDNSLSKADKKS